MIYATAPVRAMDAQATASSASVRVHSVRLSLQSIHARAKAWLAALMTLLCWLLISGMVSTALAGETVSFFHNDAAGSPALATDVNGLVTWKETYQPYGEQVIKSTSAANNQLWFAGMPYDASSGLSYIGARYYDPQLGRFLAVDPAKIDFDQLNTLNRYAYANNNPYKFVDPDGHSPIDVAFLVYDVGKLGVALYKGEAVTGALVDVGLSVVGVLSPVPGTGQAIKAARAVDRAVEVVKTAENVSEAARGAEKAVEAINTGDNLVYQSIDTVTGNVQYVGITNSLERRAAQHLGTKGITIDAIPGLSNLSRYDARSVEQVLIEHHGLGKDGGTLMNKINSIAKTNPAYADALRRGAELLRNAGYAGF